MDERQQKIKEGAGLEESRLNTDFIDFLQSKWVTYFLVLVAAAAGLYWLKGQRDQSRLAYKTAAFAEYDAVNNTDNPSPTSLIGIAEQYGDVDAIAAMARLRAADMFMTEAVNGVVLGAQLDADGEVVDESAKLSDEEIADRLDQAERQYRLVFDGSGTEPGAALHAIGAAFGLASVAETRGDLDKAVQIYAQAETIAQDADYQQLLNILRERKASAEAGLPTPRLWDADELPEGKMIAATRNYGLIIFREGDNVEELREDAYTGNWDKSQAPGESVPGELLDPIELEPGEIGPVAPDNGIEGEPDNGIESGSDTLGGDSATDDAATEDPATGEPSGDTKQP